MSESAPLLRSTREQESGVSPRLGGGNGRGGGGVLRPRSGSVTGRVRAQCAWLSKRTSVSYDDMALDIRETSALEDLRVELCDDGPVSGATLSSWQADTREGLPPHEDAEARVEYLCKQLWNTAFSTAPECTKAWGHGCTCNNSSSSSPSCPAGLAERQKLIDSTTTSTSMSTSFIDSKNCGLSYPSIPSKAWICLGFQQSDPRTDMRAVGIVGLSYFVRFLSDSTYGYQNQALQLAAGCARGLDLPLAIAAFNVQYMLLCHLHLLRQKPAF